MWCVFKNWPLGRQGGGDGEEEEEGEEDVEGWAAVHKTQTL